MGGAQIVVTGKRSSTPGSTLASKRGWSATNTVAPAYHGANSELQACLAQPGEEMFRCTSHGCRPS